MRKIVVLAAILMLTGALMRAEGAEPVVSDHKLPQKPDLHAFDSKGPWCVSTGWSYLGVTYDPANGDLSYYVSAQVMFLHVTPPNKTPSVRFLGGEVGVSFGGGSGRGITPLVTFVPIAINQISLGITPYRVPRRYDADFEGERYASGVMVSFAIRTR